MRLFLIPGWCSEVCCNTGDNYLENLSVLRILVFSLLLANILLIALRMMQPDSGSSAAPAQAEFPSRKLPTIELAESLPENEMSEDAPTLGQAVTDSTGQEPAEATSALTGSDVDSAPIDQESMACIQVGPFENEASMVELKAELSQLFDSVQTREKRSIVDKGFWVYVPKYSTRAEAEQAVRELTAAGARELYIVPDGTMANAISLGFYARRERAEDRRLRLNDLGLVLDFMIEPQTEIEMSYWMEAGPVNPLNPTLIGLSYNNPDVQQIQVDCTGGEPRVEPGATLEDLAAENAEQN